MLEWLKLYEIFIYLFIIFIAHNFVLIYFAVHCGSIRQTASILSMSQDCLRTGDKALVHFRFVKNPEYIKTGQRMVFREGRTKAVGNILRLISQTGSASLQNCRTNKSNKVKYFILKLCLKSELTKVIRVL